MLNNYFSQEFLAQTFFGNTYEVLLVSLLTLIGLTIVFKIFLSIVVLHFERIAKKTETDIDDTFIEIVKTIKPPFYFFIAFYFALKVLTINPFIWKIVTSLLILWIVYQAIAAVSVLVDYIVKKSIKEEEENSAKSAINLINKIVKGILWAVGLMFLLSNLGINITSLVATLGIGGIAIALAMQSILGDLFSSFAIYFDKPFQIGDYIIVGDKKGVVQDIGIKTTRIKATQGEEIIISNNELTSAHIQNFQKLTERRINFSFGILYETPREQVEALPKMIEEIIKAVPETRFDRVHFTKFDDSALAFEAVYYVLSSKYAKSLDIQQVINFAIIKKFEEEKIGMAYPTRTVYMHQIKN